MIIRILFLLSLVVVSCKKETKAENPQVVQKNSTHITLKPETKVEETDTIIISKKHKINHITCDLDGDEKNETVEIVQSTNSGKSGLRITFGNGKRRDYLGLGKNVLNQGFDEIDWAGIFEKAPKGTIVWNNVNDDGEIMSEEEIKEEDKIKLPNDGIFIHVAESCGGGIIYLKNGKYEWIQQE